MPGYTCGTINSGHTAITRTPDRTQSWDHDALGNFESVTTDDTSQTRTHNKQNEATGVGSNTLAYDGNGNLTTNEQGRTLKYDAWTRLVVVKSRSTVLAAYTYDARVGDLGQ